MKFINDINEQYVENLQRKAIEHCIDTTKEDISLMQIIIIASLIPLFVLSAVLFIFPEMDIFIKGIIVAGGILCILFILFGCYGIYDNHNLLNKLKSGVLNENTYLADERINEYKSRFKKYNHMKDSKILKHEVSMFEDYEHATIEYYYETKENIVEKKNFNVKVKQHTKINDYELHLTEDGLVLYVPYQNGKVYFSSEGSNN